MIAVENFNLRDLNNFLIHLINLLCVFLIVKNAASMIINEFNKYNLMSIIVLVILMIILPNMVDAIISLKGNFNSENELQSINIDIGSAWGKGAIDKANKLAGGSWYRNNRNRIIGGE